VTVADLGLVNAQLAQPVTGSNYLKRRECHRHIDFRSMGTINSVGDRAARPLGPIDETAANSPEFDAGGRALQEQFEGVIVMGQLRTQLRGSN
jgi:hypothetical protein